VVFGATGNLAVQVDAGSVPPGRGLADARQVRIIGSSRRACPRTGSAAARGRVSSSGSLGPGGC